MKSFFGIPMHPLLVHLPAVLLPLAALGVIALVVRPAWQARYRWIVLVLAAAGTFGAVLSASAGEELEEQIIAKEGAAAARGWEEHVEAGDTARLLAIVFLVAVALFLLVPWFVERRAAKGDPIVLPKWVGPVLAVLALAGATGSVITVIDAGHSGAKAVWCEVNNPPNCDEEG